MACAGHTEFPRLREHNSIAIRQTNPVRTVGAADQISRRRAQNC